MLFIRMQLGFLLQTIPFALLCAYCFSDRLRFRKPVTLLATEGLLVALSVIFGLCCIHLLSLPISNEYRYQLANVVFLFCLIPCGLWFFLAVKSLWQQKLFVLSFSATSAMVLTSIGNLINAVISHYGAQARNGGIRLEVRIQLFAPSPARETDMAILLGNLLENAIRAAERTPGTDRWISLNLIQPGKMFALTVDNSFDGHVHKQGDTYLSTKAEHSGIGLQSIQDIAERYGGGTEFSHEGQVFHASVMLRGKGEEGWASFGCTAVLLTASGA